MGKAWLVLVAGAGVIAAAPRKRQGGGEALTVSAVRFYRAASATTTIEGVCELRLAAVAAGSAAPVRYRVQVSVRDSTGLELVRTAWDREEPAAIAAAPGATAVETFLLPPAAPGLYRIEVQVIPAAGQAIERTVEVRAYAGRPAVSDLLLATAARQAGSDTETVSAGEVRRGSLVLTTAPVPHLTPTGATLSYYAEVYPWPGASLDGQMVVRVLGPGGRQVIETAPKAVRFEPAGGATEGSLDLAGLPAGEYRLQMRVRLGDSTVSDEAPFEMGATSTVAAGAPARPGVAAGRFAEANEAQLDSLYAPLVYLLKPGEQGVFSQLAVSGKRRFLEEFWARRGAAEMRRFYAAVDFANRRFHEGGAGQIPGWRTDRGRIYLKNGPWDEILQRPMASPSPYEGWLYTRGRQRWYVFVDRSGLGDYQLIGTNDRQEVGMPDWGQLLGSEDSVNVAQFLGLTAGGVGSM